jgi:hypothetical protein
MKRVLTLFALLLSLGCTQSRAGAPTVPGADAGGAGGPGPTDMLCPAAFTACGGNPVGTWTVQAMCPADGLLVRPCEHPWDTLPECGPGAASGTCEQRYGGTLTLRNDGTATFDSFAGFGVVYELSPGCLEAASAGATPEERCAALAGERLSCTFADGTCTCEGGGEPESEVVEGPFTIDGDHLRIATAIEPIEGDYCVEGDRLLVEGALGWQTWILTR